MFEELPDEIKTAFSSYDTEIRDRLLHCRTMVFEVAASHPDIGPISECLKWGQPSYLTEVSGSGSTLRLAPFVKSDGSACAALYVHCATDLIDQFQTFYRDDFAYQGKRALLIDRLDEAAEARLRHCIALTLSYKLRKRSSRLQRKPEP